MWPVPNRKISGTLPNCGRERLSPNTFASMPACPGHCQYLARLAAGARQARYHGARQRIHALRDVLNSSCTGPPRWPPCWAGRGRRRSREFIALLKDLDGYYPADCTIRLILDNHSAQISKDPRAYLATRPNRFKYVLTPTHGSWLNIIETLFGKMARTFLRHIRVQSWEELRNRILKGIEEINADPVVHRWKKFDALGAE
jgi:hypothetical protein